MKARIISETFRQGQIVLRKLNGGHTHLTYVESVEDDEFPWLYTVDGYPHPLPGSRLVSVMA